MISRTRELCVSGSNTEKKRHPPGLKLLLNGEASAPGRHFVTLIYPSEPIGGKKKGRGQATPACSYCASASEPQPPAPLPAGRWGSCGACASPPWKQSQGGTSDLARAHRERGLRAWSQRRCQRGLGTLVTCQPPSGFEKVRAPIAAETLAGGVVVTDFGGLRWCGGWLRRQPVDLGEHEACAT